MAIIDDFRELTFGTGKKIKDYKKRTQDKCYADEIERFALSLTKGETVPIPWNELRSVLMAAILAASSIREVATADDRERKGFTRFRIPVEITSLVDIGDRAPLFFTRKEVRRAFPVVSFRRSNRKEKTRWEFSEGNGTSVSIAATRARGREKRSAHPKKLAETAFADMQVKIAKNQFLVIP